MSTNELEIVSPNRRAFRRFRRHRLAVFSLIVMAVLGILALGAPLFERYPPNGIDLKGRVQPPNVEHWLGTDALGRDIWSRLVHGGRVSLTVGLSVALASTAAGALLGTISGYYGGKADMIIMRATDIMMTFPDVLLLLTLSSILGPGMRNLVLIMCVLGWTGVARLVRGQVLSLREQEFVLAARAIGASGGRIIRVHLMPNVLAPLVASVTFSVGGAILSEAALSFLGMGIPLPTPSWGNMLESARHLETLQHAPWIWMAAAAMILITVMCVNFIGDGIRDAIDPRLVLK